jgi:hypothetical protein
LLLGAVFALPLLGTACSAPDPAAPAAEDDLRERAIVGHVEPPEAGIGIIAIRNGVETATTLTDERGDYRLAAILAGEYSLVASGAGFFTDTSVRNLVVPAEGEVRAPDIRMRPLASAATVRGRVLDETTGGPLEDVQVVAQCRSGICANLSTTTDGAGRFQIALWPDLAARLLFTRRGYATAQVSVAPQPPDALVALPDVRLQRMQE